MLHSIEHTLLLLNLFSCCFFLKLYFDEDTEFGCITMVILFSCISRGRRVCATIYKSFNYHLGLQCSDLAFVRPVYIA